MLPGSGALCSQSQASVSQILERLRDARWEGGSNASISLLVYGPTFKSLKKINCNINLLLRRRRQLLSNQPK